MSLRVLLVDDVAEMRTLVRTVLRRKPGIEIAGEAGNGRQAVALAAEQQPDVVVLDLGLPDLEGKEVLSGIRNHAPATRVVVFSGTRLPDSAAIAGLVEGFVSKEQDLELLVETLEAAGRQALQLAAFELPRHPRSVGRARELTQETLLAWGLANLVADCMVVVSELVTNAVVHAATQCELRLSNHRASLRVAVVDYGPGTPDPLDPSSGRLGGRGLQIVDSLSTAWGVSGLSEDTKLVWAELARR